MRRISKGMADYIISNAYEGGRNMDDKKSKCVVCGEEVTEATGYFCNGCKQACCAEHWDMDYARCIPCAGKQYELESRGEA